MFKVGFVKNFEFFLYVGRILFEGFVSYINQIIKEKERICM